MNTCKILFLIFLISANVIANEKTDAVFAQNLKDQGLNPSEQSYCYTDELGNIEGNNVDMQVRLASTSKLITSLWAVEKIGLDHVYNLTLFIKGNDLHIKGSFDPYLGNEKMMYLISQLNELGYTHFDKITFDKNVLIFPDVQYETDVYPSMSPGTIKYWLNKYFNTASWSKDFKDEYLSFYSFAKSGRFRKNVTFDVTNIEYIEQNPFENDSEVKVLTLASPPLYKYLKEMNVKSNNYMAETLFLEMGGVQEFEKYMSEKFNLDTNKIHFYTGSGLPSSLNGQRVDNYSTCKTMLGLVSVLKKKVEDQHMTIQDVMAVPGSDKGTFRNRTFSSDLKNSIVAKTGTLMHTSTLAGAMETQKGFSFFGIFNQSTDIGGSKIVQNEMVKSIMTELGGPLAFDYQVNVFHSYDDVVKDLILNNFSSDFTSIDGELQ